MDVLLECENGTKDLYWRFLNQRGMFDFISDIILPLEERGLSIDTCVRNQRATIVTDYIRIENQLEIIESVKNRII